MRRVKSLSPPISEAGAPPADAGTDSVEPAEAVECVLEARMWRAVMAPWQDWDADSKVDPGVERPCLQRSSVGAVVASASGGHGVASGKTGTDIGPKPHDMLHDDIVVLVGPAAAETLCVGMGLKGTWVQLARVQDGDGGSGREKADGDNAEMDKTKNNKLTQEAQKGLRYWYMEELMAILPSYHIV